METTGFFRHPVWLAGFRPFFTLAFLSGALLPLLWGLVFSGALTLPAASGWGPIQWHAHEMLFGFGWAVLGGFLLTASKNWVGVRGIHGGPLALAVLLWLLERAVAASPIALPALLRLVLLNACVAYVGGYVLYTLIRHREDDSFSRDNLFFFIALPALLVAKNLTIEPRTFVQGYWLTIGMFRVAFAVMLERTLVPFMRGGLEIELPRYTWLDFPAKALVLLAAFEAWLPPSIAAVVLALAAAVLLVRFFLWSPLAALTRFQIGVMYVGYFGLAAHLLLEAARLTGRFVGIGSVAVHTFTFMVMGIIIPPMLMRICQGHTGRDLVFTRSDRVAMGAMGLAGFFRLFATQLWPAHYVAWIALAASGWTICFTLVGVRLVPFLLQARVDGEEH